MSKFYIMYLSVYVFVFGCMYLYCDSQPGDFKYVKEKQKTKSALVEKKLKWKIEHSHWNICIEINFGYFYVFLFILMQFLCHLQGKQQNEQHDTLSTDCSCLSVQQSVVV